MDLQIKPGTYVLAVSGGVDSMTLLHAAAEYSSEHADVQLIVAHFDHGIRNDSHEDRILVQQAAKHLGLPFEYSEGKLGPNASEAEARAARYKFLDDVKKMHHASAIMTAHHRDDVLETAVLNLRRGTHRRGLTSLRSTEEVVRPFLDVSKKEIVTYAKAHNVKWREDSTNADTRLQRNHVRQEVLTHLSAVERVEVNEQLKRLAQINYELDAKLIEYLQTNHEKNQLNRERFNLLPDDVAIEVMAAWLRQNDLRNYDTKALKRLVSGCKNLNTGSKINVYKNWYVGVKRNHLALTTFDR